MAYGELYRCTFDDAAGNECIVSIYRDGFSGSVTEVEGGETPIRIEMMAAGDAKYTPIKATEAYIELVSSSSFQYLHSTVPDGQESRDRYPSLQTDEGTPQE